MSKEEVSRVRSEALRAVRELIEERIAFYRESESSSNSQAVAVLAALNVAVEGLAH
jgi:cell division protein ZapA (FtsZ GTPase activity inhibitor)